MYLKELHLFSGGLQASVMTLERRDIEREYQVELEWEDVERSEDDASDDDMPMITLRRQSELEMSTA